MKTVNEIEKIIQQNKKELREKFGLKEIGYLYFTSLFSSSRNASVLMLHRL